MDFDTYVHGNYRSLIRLAMVLEGGRAWLAEDLVADVLARAYTKWARIGKLDHPHAYVRRMVFNDYLAARRRPNRMTPVGDVPDTETVPDVSVAYSEHAEMRALLERLPKRQRAAIVLRFYLGLDDGEIAAALSCRQASVRSLISRALSRLRIELAEEQLSPESATPPFPISSSRHIPEL